MVPRRLNVSLAFLSLVVLLGAGGGRMVAQESPSGTTPDGVTKVACRDGEA